MLPHLKYFKLVFMEPVSQFYAHNNNCRSDNNCSHCSMK